MNKKIIASIILWLISGYFYGFNLATILGLVSTCMFCARKVKYVSKIGTHIFMEGMGIFLTVSFQLLFKRFYIGNTVVYLLTRIIFFILMIHEQQYVYVTVKEGSKDEEELRKIG